jgi:putative FmdB family regulatory protein
MPTYEYRCPAGHEFELVQRMSDEPKARCPICGEQAERLLSAGAGFLFKGEGFYITDYRSEDYRKAAKSEGKAGAEGKAGTGTKEGSGGSEVSGPSTPKAEPPAASQAKREAAPPPPSSKATPATKSPPKKKGGASKPAS